MDNWVIKAEGLCRNYKMGEVTVNALKEASFEIYDKEFVVVLGHSGSGKSTLLNILGGMDEADQGSLWYTNKDVTKFSNMELVKYRRNTVGFVFQFFNLIPSLTAKENVALAADISKNPLNIKEVMDMVGLSDRMDHFPSQLSGGEQQRVAIARAIVKNPALLLCDEPTGALDINTGINVIKLLLDFNKRFSRPVIIITHNTAIAKLADRVFHMHDGRIDRVEDNPNPQEVEDITW
jgi:putative ABC transport system ATP-binding protein